MAVVRTFVAVLLSAELKGRIAAVQDKFKKLAPDLKWVSAGNFHVTLKFLGNIEEERLDSVQAAVNRAVTDVPPFRLAIVGAGAFPNARRPRVVWVGMGSGAAELTALSERIQSELEGAGFPKEDKEFKAHVTIGRARDNGRTPDLSSVIHDGDVEPLGIDEVKGVVVMKSELLPKGPIYTPLREIRLTAAEGDA